MDETKFKETGGLHSGRRSRAPTSSKNGQNCFSLKLLVLCYFFTKIGCTLRVANTRIRGDLILKNCNTSKLKVTESQTKFPKNQKILKISIISKKLEQKDL